MASIQVVEIRPLEYEIEDLSYDVAGNISGGGAIIVEGAQEFSFGAKFVNGELAEYFAMGTLAEGATEINILFDFSPFGEDQ